MLSKLSFSCSTFSFLFLVIEAHSLATVAIAEVGQVSSTKTIETVAASAVRLELGEKIKATGGGAGGGR